MKLKVQGMEVTKDQIPFYTIHNLFQIQISFKTEITFWSKLEGNTIDPKCTFLVGCTSLNKKKHFRNNVTIDFHSLELVLK